MALRSKKGIVAALIAWTFLLGGGAIVYHFVIDPMLRAGKEKEAEQALIAQTSASGNGSPLETVRLYADAFSGYAFLRSAEINEFLEADGIHLEIIDDQADYATRMDALNRGKAQMAAFPLNSFIQAGSKLGKFPAPIALIIDETHGADAMLAYKEGLQSIQDLNQAGASIHFTPDSPSEFLAEITVESFILPELPQDWRKKEPGSEQILRKMLRAKADEPTAYVMWEPEISKALRNPNIHILLDSSKTKGFILDALVVERSFLQNHPEQVQAIIKAYLRTVYQYTSRNALVELVKNDSAELGAILSTEDARNIAHGIQWKNTTDNLIYFGLNGGPEETLESILAKIAKVMQQTGLIDTLPLDGAYHQIYYDQPLRQLRDEKFHPGTKLDLIAGANGLKDENASAAVRLAPLTDSQWEALLPIGHFHVEEIGFPRMSDKLTLQNTRKLEDLAQRLKNWPSYYVTIIGQSQYSEDQEINRMATELAQHRAESAAQMLIRNGIASTRLRTKTRLSKAEDWSALNLVFEAGQLPY